MKEGYKFIRPGDGSGEWLMVQPNWIGWHNAQVLDGKVLIPTQLLNGQRVVVELTDSMILGDLEAPSVEEFLAKKQADNPPSEDNTYTWD
jgi:hypothetical protein